MITSRDFYRLVYKKPKLWDDRERMGKIKGIDSEAYTSGKPFMFCTSDGDTLWPSDLPAVLFEPEYVNSNWMVYNLKYDAGAILTGLPSQAMKELWKEGKVYYNGYSYSYIPHKMLRIKDGNDYAVFWDISQFYQMSLDKAAKTYLGEQEGKIKMTTKKFTPRYVQRFWKSIAKYCIHDASLTARLGEYLLDKLDEFGINVTSLYSCASISFKYFCDHSKIVTSWRYWELYPQLLEYASDAYEGGKFEVTSRGAFSGYEYDLTSAYPYEIANLVDIDEAEVVFSENYEPEAVYGFMRVFIDNSMAYHIPCGIMVRGVRTYPAGKFYLTVTKQEYEYMRSIGVSVEVISGWYLFVSTIRYPYRKAIADLFQIKKDVKGKDRMLYHTSKIVMNSFYGKMAQCIEQSDGSVVAGPGWNPVYAGVITANTRIKVTRIQNMLGPECIAVHTDSVMTTNPIPAEMICTTGDLGEFEYVDNGNGILIACGMYQLNNTCAYKGFKASPDEDWNHILRKNRNRKKFPYKVLHVESWIEAMAKNHSKNRINVFENAIKMIDLNCDTKRTWFQDVKGIDLLTNLHQSTHLLTMQDSPPSYWERG